jgi:hypothetical protein
VLEKLPAFTQCADYIDQTVAVMIENDGAKRFELTALKGGDWKTVTFEQTLELGQCIGDKDFYAQTVQPVLQDECGSCHNAGNPAFNANATWSQFETTINSALHRLYQAPSNQEAGHSPQPLKPYDVDYRAIFEIVWRQLQQPVFQCS